MQNLNNDFGKQFTCSFPGCNKEYSTKFALKRHSVTHSGKKKFACRFCSKRFALEQYQKEHEYIHTNETPYICGIDGCNETFRQRAKLCLHRMSHQGYQKKNYRIFSRKDTIRTAKPNKYAQNFTSYISNQNFMNDEIYYNFDGLNNLSFDYMMGGCSYESVISSLSLKYCMCDVTDGYVDYSLLYSNLLDISSYIPEPTHMQQARSHLSTLKIPKGSFEKSSNEQLTPSTFDASPTLENVRKENFSVCSNDLASQAQRLGNMMFNF